MNPASKTRDGLEIGVAVQHAKAVQKAPRNLMLDRGPKAYPADEMEGIAEATRSFEAFLGILREWDEAEHQGKAAEAKKASGAGVAQQEECS